MGVPPFPLHPTAEIVMGSLPAYRPSNGATLTLDAGAWTAAGRPSVRVTVTLDARLLMQFVYDAARQPTKTAKYGLGKPPLTTTLT